MALIFKGGAVFLHVPKTGGNWVTDVLRRSNLVDRTVGGEQENKHLTMDCLLANPVQLLENKRVFGGIFGKAGAGKHKPFMFCFVRNPLAWYESWFKYMSQPTRYWRHCGDTRDVFGWHPCAGLNGLGDPTFSGFIRNVLRHRPGFVSELYADFAKPHIDFIGRQESLRDDLVTVLRMLQVDFDEDFVRTYQEVGVSPKPDRPIEWEPDLRDQIIQTEQIAMVRYGYDGAAAVELADSVADHKVN